MTKKVTEAYLVSYRFLNLINTPDNIHGVSVTYSAVLSGVIWWAENIL